MDSLMDKVICSACKQPFGDTPKVLPGCLHVFCLSCLNKLPIAFTYGDPTSKSTDEDQLETVCSSSIKLNIEDLDDKTYAAIEDEIPSYSPDPSPLDIQGTKPAENCRSKIPSPDFILSVSCPKCRRSSCLPASGFNGLKTSYVNSNLADSYRDLTELQSKLPDLTCDKCVERSPAVTYCCTCRQLICEDHAKCHKIWKEFAVHKIVQLSSLPREDQSNPDISHLIQQHLKSSLRLGDVKCQRHSGQSNNQIKFFCSICEDLACVNCTVSTHRDGPKHSCLTLVPDVISERREIIVGALEVLNNLLQDLDVFATNVQTQSEAICNKGALVKDGIDAVFTEIIDRLESRKLSLFDEVDAIMSKPLKKLKECDKRIGLLQDHVLESCNFVHENLKCEGDLGLMSVANVISSHSKEVVQEYKCLLPEGRVDMPVMEFTEDREKLSDSIAEFGRINAYENWSNPSRSKFLPPGLKFKASMYSKILATFNSVTGVFDSRLLNNLTGEYLYSRSVLTSEELTSPLVISVPRIAGIHLRTIEGTMKPSGIMIDKDMKLVVCELGRHQVLSLDQDGMEVSSFGKKGEGNGQFLFPQKTVCDSQGKIIVADSMYRIQMFDRNRKFLRAIGKKGKGSLQFNDPVSLAISPDKQLYICERENQRIQVLNHHFKFQSFIGKAGNDECEFYFPTDIAISKSGRLYVADSGNHRIQVLTLQGSFIFSFGKKGSQPGELCQPSHLCVDSEGVYVTEEGNHRVSIFTLNGLFIRCIGKKGMDPGEFRRPMGVTIDNNKTLYVCDCNNDRIQIFK